MDGDGVLGVDGDGVDGAAGYSVAAAGDVNADGLADFWIGAPFFEGSTSAYLVYGPVTGTADLQTVAQGVLEASILDDLGADSLDVVELVMSLEDAFDIEVPDEEVEAMRTIGDIQQYVHRATA